MGDMPIYVGYHSADVWANKKQFLLVSCYSFVVRNDILSMPLKYSSSCQLLTIQLPGRIGAAFLF